MRNTPIKTRHRLTLLLAVATLAFACNDDGPDADAEKPVISFIAPGTTNVSGTVHVNVVATDNIAVTAMRLFIDNSTSPVSDVAAGAIDYSWDTKTLVDGVHILKAVAVDNSGNTTEARISVNVHNVLLTYTFPLEFSPESQERYVVVSDEDGNVLGYKQLHGSETYEFIAPDGFTGQRVMLTEVVMYPGASLGSTTGQLLINTFTDVPLGDYEFVLEESRPTGPDQGSSQITVSDARNYDNVQYVGTEKVSLAGTSVGENGYVARLTLRDTNAAVMLKRVVDGRLSYLYKEISLGQSYTQSLSDFVIAETQSITVPVNDPYVTITGDNKYGRFYYWALGAERVGSTISVPVPDIGITSFSTQISTFKDGNIENSYWLRDAQIATNMKTIDGTLDHALEGNTIKIAAVPPSDYLIFWTYGDVQDNYVQWSVAGASGVSSLKVPKLPQELVDKYGISALADLAKQSGLSGDVYDVKEYNNYGDYLQARFNPNTTVPHYTEYWFKRTVGRSVSRSGKAPGMPNLPDHNYNLSVPSVSAYPHL